MQLIEVNMVRSQALQGGVDGLDDMLARHALIPGLGTHLADTFCGKDERLPLPVQPRADDLFRAPHRRQSAAQGIDIRRIDEIDPSSGEASMMAWLLASSHCRPKVVAPRHRRDTRRPVRPKGMCFMRPV